MNKTNIYWQVYHLSCLLRSRSRSHNRGGKGKGWKETFPLARLDSRRSDYSLLEFTCPIDLLNRVAKCRLTFETPACEGRTAIIMYVRRYFATRSDPCCVDVWTFFFKTAIVIKINDCSIK